jgi:hypothetical protein
MRYILDTNAIAGAAADHAIAHHLITRRDGWHPTVTMTVLCEIFEACAISPLDSRLAAECGFLLDLWDLFPRCMVPDNAIGMWAEFHGIDTTFGGLPSYQTQVIRQMLDEGARGQFNPAYRYPRSQTKALLESEAASWQSDIVANSDRIPIEHSWQDELLDSPARTWKTQSIVRQYLPLLGVDVNDASKQGRIECLVNDVWMFPRSVPYWSGCVRLTLYGNWFHDRLRTARKQRTRDHEHARFRKVMDDMYNFTPCLIANAVVTNDRRWRERGQEIFPEVGWHTLDFCRPVDSLVSI